MKKIDVLRLAWTEMKLDKYNMFFIFLLQSVLFLNILVLLLFSSELDSVFESYCHKHMIGIYNMCLYNIDEADLKELEEDGFLNMKLCYDEKKEVYFSFAQINSLVHLDYKLIKWKSKGVVIEAAMQDILNVIIFIKAIFICVSVLGVFLCASSAVNFYQMKIHKRISFTYMLIQIGMPLGKIGQIYRIPFLIIDTFAVLNAYLFSFPVIEYFEKLIRGRFIQVSLLTEKRHVLTVVIYIVSLLILYFIIGNCWEGLRKGYGGNNNEVV